jgi:hypothetical protein
MRNRPTIAATTAIAATSLALAGLGTSAAQASTTCTWGGTPAAPTGTFTLSPGITNTPSSGPLAFSATGTVSGGGPCKGQQFTFTGVFNPGSSCQLSSGQGRAKGLPGVVRFAGAFGGFSSGPVVPTLLYDRAGNVIGVENADILTPANLPHLADCGTPQGFTGGSFSSVVELTG